MWPYLCGQDCREAASATTKHPPGRLVVLLVVGVYIILSLDASSRRSTSSAARMPPVATIDVSTSAIPATSAVDDPTASAVGAPYPYPSNPAFAALMSEVSSLRRLDLQ